MSLLRLSLLLGCLAILACASNTPPPPGFGDSATRDAATDAPMVDAPTPDAPTPDAPVPDAPSPDAGDDASLDAALDAPIDSPMDVMLDEGVDSPDAMASVPTIDGMLSVGEWEGVPIATDTEPTLWVGNELRTLRAFADATSLYVAIEGIVEGTPAAEANAIVLYVDADLADTTTGVLDPIDLTDGIGLLDDALSAGYRTEPAFRADYTWGTRGMNEMVDGTDARIGWRDIASDINDFAWVDGADAPAVCGVDVCETRIDLTLLGAASGDTIAMFARINDGAGMAFNNAQSLPMDNPSDTTTVMEVYEVVVP